MPSLPQTRLKIGRIASSMERNVMMGEMGGFDELTAEEFNVMTTMEAKFMFALILALLPCKWCSKLKRILAAEKSDEASGKLAKWGQDVI